ncbi:acyl-CoA dehydrogenase [Metarhizium robertsii]|uniref:Acyl-CoA dehydrogenase n=1 Tax=Metarhizium robertsii TaxID=568076 RepID=A0A0A1UMK2_9HYPO|nr:acyl-CoA dehydrogenase [Metarhizium robertsii]
MGFSNPILSHDIWFTSRDHCGSFTPESFQLHYDRARSICREIGIHHTYRIRFWAFHFDLIATWNMTAFIIATIHLNLCIGILGSFYMSRRDLSDLINDVLDFKACGEFMLTEVGHGLDARNLETTTTLLPSGCFDPRSPSEAVWKAMPPSTPLCGVPRVAVVFARLIVDGHDHGVKPFVVKLCDAQPMCRGITSRVLPVRPGTKPPDHTITSFDHVLLPSTALLGSKSKASDTPCDFLRQIWRVSVGTLSLSIMGVSSIRVGSRIALSYSQRQLRRPIVKGFASYAVLPAFAKWTIEQFCKKTARGNVRQALATVFKATVIRETRVVDKLSEHWGWQGLFAYSQLELALTFQGNSIAEGDTQVLCIRVGSELLGERYSLPEPMDPTSFLAQYEAGLFQEARSELRNLGCYGNHRNEASNERILPRLRKLIEGIGNRMAYEAARACGERVFFETLGGAYKAAFSYVLQFDNRGEEDDYITAPIQSDESWSNFLQALPYFRHADAIASQKKKQADFN